LSQTGINCLRLQSSTDKDGTGSSCQHNSFSKWAKSLHEISPERRQRPGTRRAIHARASVVNVIEKPLDERTTVLKKGRLLDHLTETNGAFLDDPRILMSPPYGVSRYLRRSRCALCTAITSP
jgi:hypothetical protein